MACARGTVLRSMQGVLVPRRRHPERLMRIAAQQRFAGGGAGSVEGPVVAAGRIVGPRGGLQHAMLGRFGCQVEAAILLWQQARRLGGNDAIDASVERPPDAARDRNDVAHCERFGRVAEPAELWRQVATVELDLPVDTGNERGAYRMGVLVQCGGLTRRDLVDADGQVSDVAGDVGGTQDFRLTAECAAAQAVHLP